MPTRRTFTRTASFMASLLIALGWGQSIAAARGPKLVLLPLNVERAAPLSGIRAWKRMAAQVEKKAPKFGISTQLMTTRHSFLVGPGRERAKDCALEVPCLREVAKQIGADILVAGVVRSSKITLVAVYARAGRKPIRTGSSQKLSGADLKMQADSAAKNLLYMLHARRGPKTKASGSNNLLSSKTSSSSDAARVPVPTETDTDWERVRAESEDRDYIKDKPRKPRSNTDDLRPENLPDADTLLWNEGAAFLPDQDENPQENQETNLTSKWWFWTAIAGAAVLGATTFFVLSSGSKGGPEVEDGLSSQP